MTLSDPNQTLSKPKPTSPRQQALSLFFGGLLPVIAFTLIEEKFGTLAGLAAGMVFGMGEIIFEGLKYKKISTMTWIGNGLLLSLGGVSLILSDGIWFKLQPALLEAGFFIFLLVSWLIKKPFLVLMIQKQNPLAPPLIKNMMSGLTLRLSFFFLAHAVLATWAAFHWSSEAWALLKGLGLTFSLILYMVLETLWARYRAQK